MPNPLLQITGDQTRIDQFTAIFGTLTLPVTTQYPLMQNLSGKGPTLAYMLDLQALTYQQKAGLLQYLASTFGMPERDVEAQLERDGMPIVAELTTMLTMPDLNVEEVI